MHRHPKRSFLSSKRKLNFLRKKSGKKEVSQDCEVSGDSSLSTPKKVSVTVSRFKSSIHVLTKRKESTSPGLPRKKPLLKVSLSFLSNTSEFDKSIFYDNYLESQSTFESELSDQENQSPNDPEFIRRAAFRWREKNGLHQPDPFRYSCSSAYGIPNPPRSVSCEHHTSFDDYLNSFVTPPLSLSENLSISSSINSSSSIDLTNKKGNYYQEDCSSVDHKINRCKPSKSLKFSFKKRLSTAKSFPECGDLHLNDRVVHNGVKTAASKTNSNDSSGISVTSSIKQTSFGSWRRKRPASVNTPKSPSTLEFYPGIRHIPHCSEGLKYYSQSCHGGLYQWTASDTSSVRHLSFEDISMKGHPVTDKFAIMFPSEPRPEWHRHLRQVLQKAGQKIFKKPEHHDTNIPENLRYQLKQIYVY